MKTVVPLHKKPNFDLICRFFQALQNGVFQIHKVAAHQTLTEDMSAEAKFLIAGNDAADVSAKLVGGRINTALFSVDDTASDLLIRDRTKHWQYLLEVKRERAKQLNVLQHEQTSENFHNPAKQTFFDWAKSYSPVGTAWTPIATSDEVASASMWGSGFAIAFKRWAESLQWNQDEDPNCSWQTRGRTPLGITWLELTVNFIMVCQQWTPVAKGIGSHHNFQVTTFAFPDIPQNIGLLAMSTALQSMSRFWRDTTGHSPLPVQWLADVKSLKYFGAETYLRGFSKRPKMNYQSETIQVLAEYMTSKKTGRVHFHDLPTFPPMIPLIEMTVPQDVEDMGFDRSERYALYRKFLRQVKQGSQLNTSRQLPSTAEF